METANTFIVSTHHFNGQTGASSCFLDEALIVPVKLSEHFMIGSMTSTCISSKFNMFNTPECLLRQFFF